jgi:hypothetical protein
MLFIELCGYGTRVHQKLVIDGKPMVSKEPDLLFFVVNVVSHVERCKKEVEHALQQSKGCILVVQRRRVVLPGFVRQGVRKPLVSFGRRRLVGTPFV